MDIEEIKEKYCSICGNYEYIHTQSHWVPQKIICWKLHNESGNCHDNPNRASYAQLRKRAILTSSFEPTECAICLKIIKSIFAKKTPCGHLFHIKCLNKWEQRKMSCPMCRYKYGEDDLESLNANFFRELLDFNFIYDTMNTRSDIDNLYEKYKKILKIVNDIKRYDGTIPDLFFDVFDTMNAIQN
jgi:hypothetical protein